MMMVSAKDGPYDQADGLDYGADDYLDQAVRLRGAPRPAACPAPPAERPAPAGARAPRRTSRPRTREVTIAGDDVSLSRREYELLEFLLRHPGRVITKTELLDRVWDARGVGYEPNVVEVYVGYLRRKLGPGLIETVRGAGYRLAP